MNTQNVFFFQFKHFFLDRREKYISPRIVFPRVKNTQWLYLLVLFINLFIYIKVSGDLCLYLVFLVVVNLIGMIWLCIEWKLFRGWLRFCYGALTVCLSEQFCACSGHVCFRVVVLILPHWCRGFRVWDNHTSVLPKALTFCQRHWRFAKGTDVSPKALGKTLNRLYQ